MIVEEDKVKILKGEMIIIRIFMLRLENTYKSERKMFFDSEAIIYLIPVACTFI